MPITAAEVMKAYLDAGRPQDERPRRRKRPRPDILRMDDPKDAIFQPGKRDLPSSYMKEKDDPAQQRVTFMPGRRRITERGHLVRKRGHRPYRERTHEREGRPRQTKFEFPRQGRLPFKKRPKDPLERVMGQYRVQQVEKPPAVVEAEFDKRLEDAGKPFKVKVEARYNKQHLINDWDRIFAKHGISESDLVRAFSEGTAALGGKATLSLSGAYSSDYVSVDYEIEDEDSGTTLIHVARSFQIREDGSIYVSHQSLGVDDSRQDAGITRDLFGKLIPLYIKMGVQEVGVSANCDVGGYAWAKFGFLPSSVDWDDGQTWSMRSKTRSMLEKCFQAGMVTDALYRHVMHILDDDDPHALWKISDLTDPFDIEKFYDQAPGLDRRWADFDDRTRARLRKRNTLGKALLCDRSWDGKLDMKNEEQMRRLMAYIRPRRLREPEIRRVP